MSRNIASTIPEWMALADQHEAIARAGLPVPLAWNQCVFHLGLMVEALMKARIMKLERFNAWPSRAAEPGLYVHDLRRLQGRAGLPTSPAHPLCSLTGDRAAVGSQSGLRAQVTAPCGRGRLSRSGSRARWSCNVASEQPAMIHMQAGADYLAALQTLGLDPECLFWAEDEAVGHPVLVLVTRQFDRAGPLSLSRLLFKAYNAAATPREIDPFVLRLHSPEQALIRGMAADGMGRFIHNPPSVKAAPIMYPGHQPSREDATPAEVFLYAGGMKFKPERVYKWHIPSKKPSAMVMSRQWRRLAENIDRLAA